MMVVDDFSLFFDFLFAGVAAVIILASIDYLERNRFAASTSRSSSPRRSA